MPLEYVRVHFFGIVETFRALASLFSNVFAFARDCSFSFSTTSRNSLSRVHIGLAESHEDLIAPHLSKWPSWECIYIVQQISLLFSRGFSLQPVGRYIVSCPFGIAMVTLEELLTVMILYIQEIHHALMISVE